LTAFASIRHLDGNRVQDTVTGYYYISSLNSSGLHRTANELADRGSQQQITLGASCRYHHNLIQWGVNTVHYRFSLPFLPGKGLHNIYAFAGNAFSAASVDFNYTHRNIHVFGEAALAKGVKPAVLIGGLISLSSTTDVSWLFRHLPPNFQPLQANAFTENTVPTNESGSYTGICIRPAPGWRIDAYADLFRFPWLRFTTRSPAGGTDYLLHLSYKPDKVLEMSVRFRSQQKDQMNSNDGIFPIPATTFWKRTQLRAQLQYRISAVCELRCRADWCKVGEEGSQAEQGILLYSDLQIHPPQKKWSVTARLQYFETEGYDSRLYAYEKDVLLSFSIPAFYGRGLRHFLLFRYAGQKRWTCWARIAQTIPISSTGNETQSGTVNPVNCTIQIQYRF